MCGFDRCSSSWSRKRVRVVRIQSKSAHGRWTCRGLGFVGVRGDLCDTELAREQLTMITTGINHIAALTTSMDTTVDSLVEAFEAVVIGEVEKSDDHSWMKVVSVGPGVSLNVFEADDGHAGRPSQTRIAWRHRPLRVLG